MRRVVEANELTEADVPWISLVKRGANQAPFRILKRDDDPADRGEAMIDIQGGFWKNQQTQGEVAAVLIPKSADLEAAKARIEKAGLKTEFQKESEDSYVFLQDDVEQLPELVYFKIDDQMVLGVTGLVEADKAFMPFPESSSFKKNIASAGFFPGVRSSLEILGDTIFNILQEAASPGDSVTGIKSAVGQFQKHIVSMTEQLPAEAFKMDLAEVEAPASEEEEGEPAKPEVQKTAPTGDPAGEGDPDGEDEEKPEGEDAGAGDGGEGDDGGSGEPTQAASPSESSQDILKAIENLQKHVDTQIQEVKESLKTAEQKAEEKAQELDGKIQTAEQATAQIQKALGKKVLGDGGPGDEPVTTEKEQSSIPYLDTGVRPLQ